MINKYSPEALFASQEGVFAVAATFPLAKSSAAKSVMRPRHFVTNQDDGKPEIIICFCLICSDEGSFYLPMFSAILHARWSGSRILFKHIPHMCGTIVNSTEYYHRLLCVCSYMCYVHFNTALYVEQLCYTVYDGNIVITY